MLSTNLTALDLNLLVALDALLEAGSVSGAARAQRRSQPAMSRTLGRLRDLVGDPLLVPHGRGLALTDRARALRAPLKLLLSDARKLLEPPVPFVPHLEAAHFRVVTSDYAQVALLGPAVRWIARAAPRVTLEVLALTDDPLDLLATGRAELLFGPPAACPTWCDARPLLADGWACVRRRGATLPATVAEYLALEHIDVGTALRFGDPIADALGPERRRVRLTVPDFAGACFVAATSDLVATLPEPVAAAAAQTMGLSLGPVPFPVRAPGVSMIWPRRLEQEPAHRWLRAAVVESLRRA